MTYINNKFNEIKDDILKTNSFFMRFLRNPLTGIKSIPVWRWQTIIFIQVSTSMISGALSGIVDTSIGAVFIGIFIFPISSLIILAVTTSFFFYTAILFFGESLNPKYLTSTMMVASFPFLLFHILHPIVPPIDLIGLAFSCLLIIVALVDSFALPKKGVIRLVFAIYLIFFFVWLFSRITSIEGGEDFEPQPLDNIERGFEIGG